MNSFSELKQLARWVCYQLPSKKPINPMTGGSASTINSTTWSTHKVAKNNVDRHSCAGVGFVFSEHDNIIGIDLDDAFEENSSGLFTIDTLKPFARYIVNLFDSYTEISPSGSGIHIFGKATIENSIKEILHDVGVEIYDKSRYFTVTENMMSSSDAIVDVQYAVDEIIDIIRDHRSKKDVVVQPAKSQNPIQYPDAWIKAICDRRIKAATDMIAIAVDGTKHNTRLKAGRLMGGLLAATDRIGHHLMTDAEAAELLVNANPPSKDAYRREYKTIRSGIEYGRLTPLEIPSPELQIPVKMSIPQNTIPIQYDVNEFSEKRNYHPTDLGNGQRLVDACHDRLRYIPEWKMWMVWDGQRWAKGDDAGVMRLAHNIVLKIHDELSSIDDSESRKKLFKWAEASENAMRIDAMVKTARPYLSAASNQFDQHHHLINTLTGIVDLKTGEVIPHNPTLMISKFINAKYDPAAPRKKWIKFLETITDSNEELMTYLQRAVGYTITGHTDEHCLFFCYGVGKNGKSTFMTALRLMLGDYYITTSIEALLDRKDGENATPHIAQLPGMRCAVASEMPEGRRFNESIVKDITGGDAISARPLYGAPFTFIPTHTLWITGNYRPRITGTDEGIWRRLRVIPFEISISEDQRRPMSEIIDDFNEEMSGILAWAIDGAIQWYKHGLPASNTVEKATMEYRGEEDIIQRFINEKCVILKGKDTVKHVLFEVFKTWCENENEKTYAHKTQNWFTTQLKRKGITDGGQGRLFFNGIGLVTDHERKF